LIDVIANGSNGFIICTVCSIGYTIFMRWKPRAIGVSPIAAAVENAVFAPVGKLIRRLPIRVRDLKKA
jgi:uncharacterized protein YqfA (UPF0365 family)